MTDSSLIAAGISGAIFGLCALFFCVRWWQQRKNRLSLATQAQLDADEKRFKRRIEREGARSVVGGGGGGGGGRQIDELFDDDLDGGDDDELELNAREIEQLQILEADLARRARGGGGQALRSNESINKSIKPVDAASRKLDSALAAVIAHGEKNEDEDNENDTTKTKTKEKYVDEPDTTKLTLSTTSSVSASAAPQRKLGSKRV
jgi:hypothetical protein